MSVSMGKAFNCVSYGLQCQKNQGDAMLTGGK